MKEDIKELSNAIAKLVTDFAAKNALKLSGEFRVEVDIVGLPEHIINSVCPAEKGYRELFNGIGYRECVLPQKSKTVRVKMQSQLIH